jgi:hypothetical protein
VYFSHKIYKLNSTKNLIKNKKVLLAYSGSSLKTFSAEGVLGLNLSCTKSNVNKTKLIIQHSMFNNFKSIVSGPLFFYYNSFYVKLSPTLSFTDKNFSNFLFLKLNRKIYFIKQIVGLKCLKYISNVKTLNSVLCFFLKKNLLLSFLNKSAFSK